MRYKYDPGLFAITGRAAVPEQPYLWECLERIPCPALVVRGQTSDILSPELVERMLAKLPRGSAVEIQGAGHPVPMDQPERFIAALRAFLAS
ncbi:MAG: alpha/beta fold hydrolase [Dehalococcoidia bacterium]